MNDAAPTTRRFLTARWLHLAMLNYEVDPELLADRVPAGTQLDDWRGRVYVSMVGFRFLATRVMGVPVPLHTDFDEVNLRFYVRRETDEGVRRGVVFIKEIVPRRAIALVARVIYNENYVALPMRHRLEPDGDQPRDVSYEWRHAGRWSRLHVRATGEPALADPDSEESFITEHYWGYARQRDGSTVAYQVEHPRWRVRSVSDATLRCDVERLYGPAFAEPLSAEPTTAFLADGSDVVVRAGRPLR